MTPLEELAAKLRTFWLRDIGATSAAVSGAGSDGSVALARTLFIPAAGGLVGINQIPTDPYALDVVGNGRIAGNLYARAGNSWNIGADGTPWGAIYASELHVGNLIAENKIATTGGRILVSPSAKLILAMTTGATTIDVSTNVLTSGDRLYLESTGKLEWMAVTSGATAVNGGYRYSVTRNLNGAGAQTWSAGDAVVNTGQSGQGFIDLYSRYGIPANGQTSTTRQGPTIVGNVRTGSTFDAIKERWAVGNLKGLYDYAGTTYGFAAGDPTAAWISADATNGLRIVQATAVRVRLSPAGNLFINDSSGNAVFTFDSSAGAEFTLPLTLAATGGIYQGTGTFASPTTGLKIYNSGGIGLIAGYNTGVAQWYADTDGKLYAGAGNVKVDADGITLNKGTGYAAASALKWGNGDISVTGYYSLATNRLFLLSQQLAAGAYAQSNLQASGGTSGGGIGQVYIVATGNGTLASVSVQSNLGIAIVGALGITGNVALTGSFGIRGATSGTATIVAPAVAGTPTLTLPTASGTFALTSDLGAYVPLAGGQMTGALGIGRTPANPSAYQVVFPQGSSGASSPGVRLEGGQTDGGLAMNDGILEFWNNWRAYCSNVSGRLQGIFRFDTRSGYESEGFVIGGTLNDDVTDFMAFGINYGTGDVNLAYYGIGSVAIGTHTGAAGISGTNGNLAVYNDIYAGRDIIANSASGMKLLTDPSQKLGVWNATPIVQPTTSIGAASFTAGSGTGVNDDSTFDGYTVGQVVQALRNTGLLA